MVASEHVLLLYPNVGNKVQHFVFKYYMYMQYIIHKFMLC